MVARKKLLLCASLVVVLLNLYWSAQQGSIDKSGQSQFWLPGALRGGGNGHDYDAAAGVLAPKREAVSSATGIAFYGEMFREYSGPIKFREMNFDGASMKAEKEENILCRKWCVVTTIYKVSEAVRRAVLLSVETESRKKRDVWCTVIVADEPTPKEYFDLSMKRKDGSINETRVHYLSVEDQIKWAEGLGTQHEGSSFVKQIPWRHFSRKNIGYLFAIQRGAQIVFDFDDDNILDSGYDPLPLHESHHRNVHDFQSMSLVGWDVVRPLEPADSVKSPYSQPLVLNPFPLLGANVSSNVSGISWPRGFPLDDLDKPESIGSVLPENSLTTVPLSQIAVLLHIADKNPDIDAVHRLTKPLPMSFESSLMGKDNQCFLIPDLSHPKSYPYIPYNAQSTIHTYSALWALLLPASVPGRVSDIWRAYFSERMFRDLKLGVAIMRPPSITQERNPHNMLADMQAEEHLYYRSGTLVKFLNQWMMRHEAHDLQSVPALMEQLWIDLYERGYIEKKDVELVQLWLQALCDVGYTFPHVSQAASNKGTPNLSDRDKTSSGFQVMRGGVLPVRRFKVKPGSAEQLSEIHMTTEATQMDITQCNDACQYLQSCDAWQWDGSNSTCNLYQNYHLESGSSIGIHQADKNDETSVVGLLQRRARVIRHPMDKSNSTDCASRILYVLHFHHSIEQHTIETLLKLLLRYLPTFFDLIVVGPQETTIHIGDNHVSSLVNAFIPTNDPQSKLGCNSYMSLPIARSRFPGYGGYLLVNDDAAIRFWQLSGTDSLRQKWFSDRPWGTFPLNFNFPSQTQAAERTFPQRYPYGPYGDWAWWNRDSGSTTVPPLGNTRSNFDAALMALNEICSNANLSSLVPGETKLKVCTERSTDLLSPYMNGKADVFYVPGNELGDSFLTILFVMGEHDVMLEAAVPIAYHITVPKESALEMPYCDGTDWIGKRGVLNRNANDIGKNKEYRPHFVVQQEQESNINCPVIHPLKFGFNESVVYWDTVLASECITCPLANETKGFWYVID